MPYASDYIRNVETILVVHSFGEWPKYKFHFHNHNAKSEKYYS